jgi:predicted phosphodiesterase
MRIALFSDVHGNLSALRTVRQAIERLPDIDQVIFAGDLCLFGPRPGHCLDLLRDMAVPFVVGNTDEWLRQPPPLASDLPEEQRQARQNLRDLCRWTAGQLSDESLAWLDLLRQSFQIRLTPTGDPGDDLLIVHANPHDLLGIIFPAIERQRELYGSVRQTDEQLAPLLHDVSARTIAFGHLHIPGLRRWRDKTLINVSSVSLPGDGDGRAKFAVLSWSETAGWQVVYHRLTYDTDEETDAFRRFRPPGWQARVEQLQALGYVPQIV